MAREIEWYDDRVVFKDLVEATSQIAWMTDPDGYCIYVSPGWVNYTGASVELSLGYGWLDWIHREDRVRTRKVFFRSNDDHATVGVDYRLVRSDGSLTLAWAVGIPKFNDQEQFRGYLGVIHPLEHYQERTAYFADASDQERCPILTCREKETLNLIAEGKTSEEIAVILGISTRTVDAHVANAARKLGTTNRVHTVAKALKNGEI